MLFQKAKNRQRNKVYKDERILKNKKERMRSLRRKMSLFFPTNRDRLSGKVSFCTFLNKIRSASMAVETAFVLPLFFLGVVTMISFMDIYKIQTEHLTKLCQSAKEVGMYAYLPDVGGPEEITLPDIYAYEPIGGLVPLPKVWIHNRVRVHAWTGKEDYGETGEGGAQQTPEKMVYVTETGSVYHRSLSCSYINLSVEQISGSSVQSRRNQYGEKYEACEICSRNQNPAGTVFITGKSNRYHNLGSCSGLKRTVRIVKESEAKGMGACGRCG